MNSLLKHIRSSARQTMERLLAAKIYRKLPRGVDPMADLLDAIPTWRPHLIFDVGANLGQSAASYATRFPDSQIFSFEPCRHTYEQLARNVSRFPNVSCFNVAFGEAREDGWIIADEASDLNQIRTKTQGFQYGESLNDEFVTVDTLENFLREQQITEIQYLKIDTEGHDLKVLKGCDELLISGKIDVVEVEAGFCPENETHVPFEQFYEYMRPLGYNIFGFYEQTNEWKRGLPRLRRANIVFISEKVERR